MANCRVSLFVLGSIPAQGDVGSVAPSSSEQKQEIQTLRAKVASLGQSSLIVFTIADNLHICPCCSYCTP
jgi:hypothetical protein